MAHVDAHPPTGTREIEKDTSHSHRILVLEGGPFVIAEHTQNLPMVGLDPPSPGETANAGRVAFRKIRIRQL